MPQLTWSDVDPVEIENWFAGKMDLSTEHGKKWADAWIAYQDAVTKPWNDFVTRAEQLSVEGAELDMQTDEEIIRWLADNTFVDGVSLTDKFPQINTWVEEMKAQANWEEFYNYDDLRIPTDVAAPQSITMQGYVPSVEEEPTKFEIAVEELTGKLTEWGYDRADVESWLQSTGASWDELSKKQDKEAIELAQAQTREAADYIKGIFDSMVVELQNQQVSDQAKFETEVDVFVGELKETID